MPTYQYACTACGHELEAVQSFTDDPLTQCPTCAGRLRKVFSAVGIVFKGSGFYRTDSRADSRPDKTADTTSAPTVKESGTGVTAGDAASGSPAAGSSTSDSGSSTSSSTGGAKSNGSGSGSPKGGTPTPRSAAKTPAGTPA